MSNCRIVNGLQSLTAEQWQSLEIANNPFLSYSFLSGLENHGCLKNQYWQALHLILEEQGELLGVIPLYVKQDSYGEFVFDWAWAEAYERAGRPYYPKLVSAIPFTPASGARILVSKSQQDPIAIKNQLVSAAVDLMNENNLSSLHFLFPDDDSMEIFKSNHCLQRLTCQYYWFNQGYRDFQDFTDGLTSKKRKRILRERREIHKSGIEIERLRVLGATFA